MNAKLVQMLLRFKCHIFMNVKLKSNKKVSPEQAGTSNTPIAQIYTSFMTPAVFLSSAGVIVQQCSRILFIAELPPITVLTLFKKLKAMIFH